MNVTVLVPCGFPKLNPLIVTVVPAAADGGDVPVITGAPLKAMPLLAKPATVTITCPVVAPGGTGVTMLVRLHVVGVATIPLNVSLLEP